MEIKRYQIKYTTVNPIKYNDILNILGKTFVKNNRNKGKLIIENKKYYPNEYIQLNNFKKSEIKIDILLSKDICNLSCMFKDCERLLTFSKKDDEENKEMNDDIPQIEKNDNEFEYNINEIDESKETFYKSLKDNIIYCKCSEISKKEENSEAES